MFSNAFWKVMQAPIGVYNALNLGAVTSYVVETFAGEDGTAKQKQNNPENWKIYIWYHESDTGDTIVYTGEASIELSNGHYYSFKYGFNGSLEDDKKAEGKKPDQTVEIGHLDLDEQKIEKWLREQMKNKTRPLVGTYSCWVVYTALREGGSRFSPNPMWTPGVLFRYLRRIRKGYLPMFTKFFDSPLV